MVQVSRRRILQKTAGAAGAALLGLPLAGRAQGDESKTRKLKVIVVTGYPTGPHFKAIARFDASAFFIKPINVEHFMMTLDKIEQNCKNKSHKKR